MVQWFFWYFKFLNMTFRKETGDMIMIYDKKLNNILNENNI